MAPKSKQMASKTCLKTDAKNDAKIYRIWRPNGAKMEPKRHPKINVFLARFLEASGNIDGASRERRGSVDGHTFPSRFPRASPYYQRILYKIEQRRDCLRDLARLGPLARRILRRGDALALACARENEWRPAPGGLLKIGAFLAFGTLMGWVCQTNLKHHVASVVG